jgi:sterol desaturase/sphingolipid hydroxylase (fatty acid hydroxylase superfamily)
VIAGERSRRPRVRPSPGARLLLPAIVLVSLSILERIRPRRRRVEPEVEHVVRNAILAASGVGVNLALNRLVLVPVARATVRRRWGLLQRLRMPYALEAALAVAWLDYTLYLWHNLSHRVGWMWRLHAVHHFDRDLDASSGLRFHAVELCAAVPLRAVAMVLAGVGPRAFDLWQTAVVISSLFHHANLRLPRALERALALFVVTPGMHEIHHSTAAEERRANLSSGLSIWDRLHGTFRDDVPTEAITIGLPEGRRDEEVRLTTMLFHPFARVSA